MQKDRALARLPHRAAGDTGPLAQMSQGGGLNGRAKAAIVVRLLLNEGADLPLEDLPDELQERLTQTMGRMGMVDRNTLAAVALEFAEALDGVSMRQDGISAVVGQRIGADEAA